MAPLRALLGTLGTGLALLGRSGTLSGHSLALLGQSWAALGDQLFDCGRSWGKFWPSRASRGCLQSCSGQLFNPKILQILLPSDPPSLHASERPRRVMRSANNPAAVALSAWAVFRSLLCMHYMHAACTSCMQFMLMHAVHGMKCRAFSMLCWGCIRRTSLKTSILLLLHNKTIDFTASSAQNAAFRNKPVTRRGFQGSPQRGNK